MFFHKYLAKFLVQKAFELNYTVDIRKDAQFVKQVINMITSKDAKARPEECSQSRNTVPTKGGKAFHIPFKTFNLKDVKDTIKDVKRGDGPEISIKVLQESFSFDQSLQDLKL